MSALALAAMAALGCGGDAEIERPTPLFTQSPVEYPLELWDRDVEGSTLVRVLVNEEGGVDSAMVMESSGYSELDSAAVQGALSMEFDPATKEGEPLRVWARVPVHFSKDTQPATPGGTGNPGGEPAREGPTANPNVTSGFRR
jgi:protein TonB